jgi:hypothetical protein
MPGRKDIEGHSARKGPRDIEQGGGMGHRQNRQRQVVPALPDPVQVDDGDAIRVPGIKRPGFSP